MTKLKQDVDSYICSFPFPVQERLEKIRDIAKKANPICTETIKYGIPVYMLGNKNCLHVGAYKKWISVYPAPSGDAALDSALLSYRKEKSTLQFPHDQPLPLALLEKVIAQLFNKKVAAS